MGHTVAHCNFHNKIFFYSYILQGRLQRQRVDTKGQKDREMSGVEVHNGELTKNQKKKKKVEKKEDSM